MRDCIKIIWNGVRGASDYEIRVTKKGSGSLQYAEDIKRKHRKHVDMRGWQPRAKLFPFMNDNLAHWCGLASPQLVRARVRGVDANGVAGPSSRGSRAFKIKERKK